MNYPAMILGSIFLAAILIALYEKSSYAKPCAPVEMQLCPDCVGTGYLRHDGPHFRVETEALFV